MLIMLGTYAFRYSVGGMVSWALQWAAGFKALGHRVVMVERANYPDAFYDPTSRSFGDSGENGVKSLHPVLQRLGMADDFCVVDGTGTYHGIGPGEVARLFREADLFVDLGTHGAWIEEVRSGKAIYALIEGEPGYTQMRHMLKAASGDPFPEYDRYYSNGANLSAPDYAGPLAGRDWRHVWNPVHCPLFAEIGDCPDPAPFTTVMNWQSHKPLEFEGRTWGQKDIEFQKFMELPGRVGVPLEVAIGGGRAPVDVLAAHGWMTRPAHQVTESFGSFLDYIGSSAGEFSVCKQAYVELDTGWFSDRSAAYLAAGRPVVMQDTGFRRKLPCGNGLFAVRDSAEAAAAIETVASNPARHARAAREIAHEYLNTSVVLPAFLDEVMA